MNDTQFHPSNILKVYRRGSSEFYIEIHNVQVSGKGLDIKHTIGAGKPLTQAIMRRLIPTVHNNTDIQYFHNAWLNDRMLSCEPLKHKRHILWYKPAGIQFMSFKSDFCKSGSYHLPALLFFVRNNQINIYAMKTGQKRPNLATDLYYVPLFNTSGTSLCWGNVKLNIENIHEIDLEMQAWETALWNSTFTDHGIAYTKKTHLSVIYNRLKNTDLKFPVSELVSYNKTILNLLREELK